MANFKPIDSKREEFRKYLERAGVMDVFMKVLLTLYDDDERPADALEYVQSQFMKVNQRNTEDLNREILALRDENKDLRDRLSRYEQATSSKSVPSAPSNIQTQINGPPSSHSSTSKVPSITSDNVSLKLSSQKHESFPQ